MWNLNKTAEEKGEGDSRYVRRDERFPLILTPDQAKKMQRTVKPMNAQQNIKRKLKEAVRNMERLAELMKNEMQEWLAQERYIMRELLWLRRIRCGSVRSAQKC